MYYTDSLAVSLNAIIGEWAKEANIHKGDVLHRLCHFGEYGLIFDRAFKDSKGDFVPLRRIWQVSAALFSTHAPIRADAEAALAATKLAVDAVQDFCAITKTRLPTSALGTKGISDWVDAEHPAPPCRDPTAAEIEAADARYEAREREAAERIERGSRAANSLSDASALPVKWKRSAVARTNADQTTAGDEAADHASTTAHPLSVDADIDPGMPSCARPATAAKSAPIDKLRAWYKQRVVGWPDDWKPPSEADDMKDARAALQPLSVNRERLRQCRRALAPTAWKKAGPKSRR